MPELLVVIMIIAILVTIALPNIISWRRLMRFSAMQRQVVASLNDARQQAIGQRTPITFRYEHNMRQIKYYGGKYGALGDSKNYSQQLAGSGLSAAEIIYGRPATASTAPLDDGTNLTALTANVIEIPFQADGSVLDASRNPKNTTMFFYMSKSPNETAFAVSVLGAGGRSKTWRYSKAVNKYVE